MALTLREVTAGHRYRKEPSAVKFVPYSYHVTDAIVSTVANEYAMAFRIRGRSHECASESDLLNWRRDLNQLWKTIGNEHVRFWTHLHHHETHRYPESRFTLTFPRELDRKVRKRFEHVPLMTNDWYLTVVFNPVGDLAQKFLAKFEKPSHDDLMDIQAEAISSLEDIASQIQGAMRTYGIEPLGIYYRDKQGHIVPEAPVGEEDNDADDDTEDLLAQSQPGQPVLEHGVSESPRVACKAQFAYSSTLEFFSFLANDEWSPVPVTQDRARESLLTNRMVTSWFGDVMQSRRIDVDKYIAGVEIIDYPEGTEPGQLNLLMEADFEFVLSQQYVSMSNIAASTFLSHQEAAMLETQDKSRSQIAQMADAADDVVSRRITLGWYYGCLHLTADTPKEAQRRARSARVMLNACAIKANAIGLASEAAWWTRLPGNHSLAPRPVPLNSMNLLSFSSFHNFMVGKPDGNPWGPAVALLKGVTGTPLFFNWHSSPINEDSLGKRPPGHTILLGKTGAGKTTALNALLALSTKFDPRMFFYDVGQGMFPLVKALGGHYTVFRDGEPTGWQPAQLPPTPANIRMVKRLVRLCAEISLNAPITHEEVKQVSEAVESVMGEDSLIPIGDRTFTAIVQHIPRPFQVGAGERPSLASLLESWCRGGEHGWVFDGDRDTLDLSKHDVFGFDLTDFIVGPGQKAPIARTPLFMYLLYRVRASVDGRRRVIQTFDEFAQYLDDPTITLEVKRGLKTDRKKDCIYIFATQEANDALDSTIGKTIVQACVTKVLLYNPEATPSDYLEYLKLTPAEFDAMLSIPEDSRQFLIKQGNQSALATLDLSGMEDEISILSGTPDNAERLEKVIQQLGSDDPDAWMPAYFDAVRRRA